MPHNYKLHLLICFNINYPHDNCLDLSWCWRFFFHSFSMKNRQNQLIENSICARWHFPLQYKLKIKCDAGKCTFSIIFANLNCSLQSINRLDIPFSKVIKYSFDIYSAAQEIAIPMIHSTNFATVYIDFPFQWTKIIIVTLFYCSQSICLRIWGFATAYAFTLMHLYFTIESSTFVDVICQLILLIIIHVIRFRTKWNERRTHTQKNGWDSDAKRKTIKRDSNFPFTWYR